ncbi:MAG TPA: hypothetical protein VJX92_24980 [Methylomirabilota bacterium]|nr:hypothetical protein [Methylomirabilota bacterium]
MAGENPATQGAVPVDRVLVVRVNEAPPERSDTVKKPDEKTGKALEWTKAIGMPIVTLVITILGGYFFTTLTNDRDSRESKDRLYAQLLTQREQSDALIRKDMFGVVINRFLTEAKPTDWSTKVLQLELLANNFNQSLDLAPLFKDLGRKLMEGPAVDGQRAELKKRLDRTAANLIFKQVNSLARRGVVIGKAVALSDWEKSFGTPFIDAAVPKARLVNAAAYTPTKGEEMIGFSVEVVGVSVERREVEVRLRVNLPDADDQDVDRHFWVGQYDFPMLDNTQLPHGLRTSVVITDFFVPDTPDERDANSFVQFYLVVFPAAGASFKERQDYDDILGEMLRARDGIRRQKERH